MTFADLRVGDHFIWAPGADASPPHSANVNVKIAWAGDGGGFAVDLSTRSDPPVPGSLDPGDVPGWIPGETPVIKLNGVL